MSNPLKLCKATAVQLPANWVRKEVRDSPQRQFLLEEEGKLHGWWSLFRAIPPLKRVCERLWWKETVFLQEIAAAARTRRAERIWFCTSCPKIWAQSSLPPNPNWGSAVCWSEHRLREKINTQCLWFAVGGFGGWCVFLSFFFFPFFLIEFQRGTESFMERYICLSPSPFQ